MRFASPIATTFAALSIALGNHPSAAAQDTLRTTARAPAATSEFRVVCGHDCLEKFAERFRYGLTLHYASAVPLAPNVHYIEATVFGVPYRMNPGWPD
jgi:hypothetical protein